MKFDGSDCGFRIAVCNGQGLAAGSGTAVENVGSVAHESGDELRGFVLDDDLAGAECLGFRNVSRLDTVGGCQQASGGESDSFLMELLFRSGSAEADGCGGNGLIVFADLMSGGESIFVGPALDQP